MESKFSVLFISWINYTCLASIFNCATSIPAVELDALMEFKLNYIVKGSQQLLSSWDTGNASESVCESWVGIACTADYYHIQSINLTYFGLEGSMAPHLGNLTFLSTLDLSDNAFTGSIPPQLMGCTSLRLLDLSNNSLISPIPSSLTSLPLLLAIDLCYNSFSGPIPSPLFTNISASLRMLGLCNNAFIGSIPADLGLHASSNLHHIALWENNLTGIIPPSLSNFSDLRVLQLQYNELTGRIPVELAMLHNLQVLYLYSNHLTGAIPPTLGNCTSLSDLELTFNELTGSIPTELGLRGALLKRLTAFGNKLTGTIPRSIFANCTSLQILELSENLLSGTIWEEVGLLGNLTRLLLADNNFTGDIPSSIVNCTSMVNLDLGQNQLTGTIPASMSMLGQLEGLYFNNNHLSGLLQHLDFNNFTKLTVLHLSNNQLSGTLLPINLAKLGQIGELVIGSNQFAGEIPWGSLVNCSFLYYLDLSNNNLSGAIPSILGRFSSLKKLYLEGNMLSGAIQDFTEINNLHLIELDLSFNNLKGSLPSSLARALVTIAGYVDLSHNHFLGALPPWLGQLDQVKVIVLSHNNFTGSIPPSFGDCEALVILSLSNNHLSGDLPLQLGNLAYLQLLDLSYNNLSGVLPSFLGSRLLQLQKLNVSFNSFTGPIPADEGVFKHLTASSFQGNPGLCGSLLNKTCIQDHVKVMKNQHSPLQLKNWRGILLVTFLSGLGLALVFTGCVWLLIIERRRSLWTQTVETVDILAQYEAKKYTAEELIKATQGYSAVNLLGQGGLGVVYKGVLSDGQVVAIKKLKNIDSGSEEALLREIHILSKLRHRNLVQILGCVLNLDIKALVLQYMANGSLEQYLDHMNIPEENILSSSTYRLMVSRVAIGIAHALAYLHHGYDDQAIIHGDVKPANILLDSDLEPHLADFGLAKLIRTGAEAASLTSDFHGSIGYMAPEYAYAARITTKVDVYSFGVVVLRMLTGKIPTQVDVPHEGASLHEWVKSKLAMSADDDRGSAGAGGDSGNIWEELQQLNATTSRDDLITSWKTELPDAARGKQMPTVNNASDDKWGKTIIEDKEIVRRLLRTGLACTSQHPEDRPAIHQVLAYLTSRNSIGFAGLCK